MNVHEQTFDPEQKQRVTSRSQKPIDHRKDKPEERRASVFRLYGIGGREETHQSGVFNLYGLEIGKIVAFRLYGIGEHQEEYASGPFAIYGVGQSQSA